MVSICAVPPWEALSVAFAHWKLVEKACSRASNRTPADLVEDCVHRRATMWLIGEEKLKGICFTRVVKLSDGRRAVEVTALAGTNALSWAKRLRERMHEYRKAEYADLLLVVGRKGWGRLFGKAPVGMNADGYIFEDEG